MATTTTNPDNSGKVIMKKLTIGGKTVDTFFEEAKQIVETKKKESVSHIGNKTFIDFMTQFKNAAKDSTARSQGIIKLSDIVDKQKFRDYATNILNRYNTITPEKMLENSMAFINSNGSLKVATDINTKVKIPYLKKWDNNSFTYYLNDEYMTIYSSCSIDFSDIEMKNDTGHFLDPRLFLICAINMEQEKDGKLYSVFIKTTKMPYIQIAMGLLDLDQEVPNIVLSERMKKSLLTTYYYSDWESQEVFNAINKKYIKSKYNYSHDYLTHLLRRVEDQYNSKIAVKDAISFKELKMCFDALHNYTESIVKNATKK